MKPKELIALLSTLPDDAEVVVNGYSCDIMGEYDYENNPTLSESEALVDKSGCFHQTISNYAEGEKRKVMVLG